MRSIKTRILYAKYIYFFMIQKGGRNLVHKIQKPSQQMQPSDALMFILIQKKVKNNLTFFFQMKKEVEVKQTKISNTRGTGEKQDSVSPFLFY